ncbi:hypothetical protein PHISCL_11218, partial [Aspergillus sclerotialis]
MLRNALHALLQLDLIVQQSNLLARFEGREPNIRAAVASEGISKTAVTTTSNFSLHSKVDLGQIVC